MNQNQLPVSATQAGKVYRMGRIFGPDGKTVVLPLDHGTMLGRVSGLEDPVAALESFLSLSCDGFLIGPGLASVAHRCSPTATPRPGCSLSTRTGTPVRWARRQ